MLRSRSLARQLAGLGLLLPAACLAAGPGSPVVPSASALAPASASRVIAPERAGDEEFVSLARFASLVVSSDEYVLSQRIESEIAGQGVLGATGVYEPTFFASNELESSRVLNSSSEILQRAGSAQYAYRTNQLKSGVNVKTPLGTDVELSYNVGRTTNSLQRNLGITEPEFRSQFGARLSQPLLRNAGPAVNNAAIRVAEREQQVVRETLRQVMSQRVMEAVSVYLYVQRARERVRLRSEASDTAARLLEETVRQHRVGMKSAAEVQDAESLAAQRRMQLAQAQQDMEEQLNSFRAMVAAGERNGAALRARRVAPGDPLELLAGPVPAGQDTEQLLQASLQRRPELRANQLKTEREDIRVGYARNQMLPELSLTLRYGWDDLARYWRAPNDYALTGSPYNNWAVGVQFRYWLQGDLKRQSDYETAVLRRQQAALARNAAEQRIANEVESSVQVLQRGLQQVARQQDQVQAQRGLLRIEESLQREGRKSVLDVMKRRLDLLVAEEALADSIVVANRASFMVSQVQGEVLARLGVEP